MHPVIRSALVLLAGVVAAVLVVTLTDALASSLYPLPAGVEPSDKEAFRQAVATMPVPAFVLLLAGWVFAAAIGAYLATRLAARSPAVHGMIVALFVLVATVANLAAIPHPFWLWPAAIVLIPAAGWAATRLVPAPRAAVSPQ
jgi:pimeloyl-ACP methyl ester carboxylesterase